MQSCSWRQLGQLECGQVAWLALGFGLVDISSEIGLGPAANGSAVAPWSHLSLGHWKRAGDVSSGATHMYSYVDCPLNLSCLRYP